MPCPDPGPPVPGFDIYPLDLGGLVSDPAQTADPDRLTMRLDEPPEPCDWLRSA